MNFLLQKILLFFVFFSEISSNIKIKTDEKNSVIPVQTFFFISVYDEPCFIFLSLILKKCYQHQMYKTFKNSHILNVYK